jgi:aryl-alcohol dehydrogenase-like predicted oxidoreductase
VTGASNRARFVLSDPHVASLVVGGLDLGHFRENLRAANTVVAGSY